MTMTGHYASNTCSTLPIADRLPTIGDRVLVALDPERTCPECPHYSGEIGRTGRVVAVRAPASAPSHPYLVVLDADAGLSPILDWRLNIVARHYAAEELERIGA